MRLRKCQSILVIGICVNIILFLFMWYLHRNLERSRQDQNGLLSSKISEKLSPTVEDEITILIREFEDFEHDLRDTILSFLKIYPRIKIVIVSDKIPYPPLELGNFTNIKIISLKLGPETPRYNSQLETFITTNYLLLIPDSTRLTSASPIEQMLKAHKTQISEVRIVAAHISEDRTKCLNLEVNLREWTIKLQEREFNKICDSITGKIAVLFESSLLFNFSYPFIKPWLHGLFIQSTLHHYKVRLLENIIFSPGKPLFLDSHSKWKHDSLERNRLTELYKEFGIKKVIRSSGTAEWFGCRRDTPRCFGTVVKDMPSYLFEGKWTPPCCLEALRETARYVFKVLTRSGIRFWLEGGSLLGAARSGDIIPWDFDVDIGIYRDDIHKCEWLIKADQESVIDESGFVWEKATEGDFYRVQYSEINHLHVDIFPFYSNNGIMTKNTWFESHRQDTEFPEHYLIPLTNMHFIGIEVPAPNNVHEFLELKFGEGVVENPQYPNPSKQRMPIDNL